MPRTARVVGVDLPHHITQRGNYRQQIFADEQDYRRYLEFLSESCVEYHLSLLGYCLMPNHVHFVGIPGRADSLARTFSTAHMRYSQYYNRKQSRIGHLWQGRFYSCVLGPSHLLMAARYVERNPVRSGLAEMPWDWTWSSAGTNTGGGTPSLIRSPTLLELVDMSEDEWRQYIAERDDERDLVCLRRSTRTGRPAGDAEFVHGLESELNRRLSPLPLGRPKAAQ